MTSAVVMSTTRHRVKLQENGYSYVFDKMSTNGQKKFWRCERKSTCNARIHTDALTNQVIKRATPHNHMATFPNIESIQTAVNGLTDTVSLQQSLEQIQAIRNGVANLNDTGRTSSQDNETLKKEYGGLIIDASGQIISSSDLINELSDYNDGSTGSAASSKAADRIRNGVVVRRKRLHDDSVEANGSEVAVKIPKIDRSSMVKKLNRYLSGGLITWSDEITDIIRCGESFCRKALNASVEGCASLLITGESKSGRSCLAALIAKNSDAPCLKICQHKLLAMVNEQNRVAYLHKLYDEASSAGDNCLIFIDGIDAIIDHCVAKCESTRSVLRALKILLDEEAPEENRIVVVATSSLECADAFDLKRYFTRTVQVPLLTNVEHLMAVIEDSNIFVLHDECERFRKRLMAESHSYSIGIKRLLSLLSRVKDYDASARSTVLLQELRNFKGS